MGGRSIQDVPANARWTGRSWVLGGRRYTLNELAHDEIHELREPRAHFALNCGSVGCPPLRREAYVGARQARRLHADSRRFRYEPGSGVVSLTRLYDWHEGDFAQVAGSPVELAARYSAALREDLDAGHRPEVRWLEYDWRLNARRSSP